MTVLAYRPSRMEPASRDKMTPDAADSFRSVEGLPPMKTEAAKAAWPLAVDSAPPSDPLVAALRHIARFVSSTLELREVFTRVAEATATVMPLEFMGVVRVKGPDTLELYSLSGGLPDSPVTLRLEDFSPAIRPLADRVQRLDDLVEQLDPSFAVDRKIQQAGMRSSLLAPLLRGEHLAGYVMVESRQAGAFTAGHETALQSIADLLSLALEHE